MCGIVGFFGHENSSKKVITALAKINYRGMDSAGISNEKEVYFSKKVKDLPNLKGNCIGHVLHAIVEIVPQPIKGKGILAANCEIYNWKKLKEKYNFKGNNDSQVLLEFLDEFGVERLDELDGVYAFAYWRNDKVYLARDLIGVKPLWYNNSFAFASEKKVLIKARELHPRHILIYDIKTKKIETKYRKFFELEEELNENYEKIKKNIQNLLEQAIEKRVPNKKFGILFSGGVDSVFIANYFKKRGYDFTCYTATIDSNTKSHDLIAAQEAAEKLDLNLKIRKVKIDEIPSYLKKIAPLIEQNNVIKNGVALTFYLACELAKQDGCKVIFTGLGSEEVFAGYERHKHSTSLNNECVSGLRKLFERDLYRDDVLTMANQLEIRIPFLDKELIPIGLKIPAKYKIVDGVSKYIFRDIAKDMGIPDKIAFRPKKAAQYGSRIDQAIKKLAKKNGKKLSSEYMLQFFPKPNAKLGIMCSSGKDSWYAAYIMARQNYELTCQITLKSNNKDSYMFHTPAIEMAELQAKAANIPIILKETNGEKEVELEDLKDVLLVAKENFQIDGIVTGALFSTYQRDRIERICDELGLKVFSPLWHKNQAEELRELIDLNFEVILSSIAADGFDKKWVGRKIDYKMLEDLKKLKDTIGNNVAFEGGEAESLVLDCPLFLKKIKIIESIVEMESEYCGKLIIKSAELVEK